MKDSIDFGSMNISTLFRKLLIPTVLGMVFSALFVITDGIFVGKGIGSDALSLKAFFCEIESNQLCNVVVIVNNEDFLFCSHGFSSFFIS